MKRVIFIAMMSAAALTSFLWTAFAQNADQSASPKQSVRAGSITGRIVNESGKPMPGARVIISGSSRQAVRRTISTDEAGRFAADDLPRGSYAITAQSSGYVLVREPGDTVHHRPGDTVNLVLRKGGAITGTVTNSNGDPVVGVQMSATLFASNSAIICAKWGRLRPSRSIFTQITTSIFRFRTSAISRSRPVLENFAPLILSEYSLAACHPLR